jgi:hypothetical protein
MCAEDEIIAVEVPPDAVIRDETKESFEVCWDEPEGTGRAVAEVGTELKDVITGD